jgi:carboxymethylenebutenolidase
MTIRTQQFEIVGPSGPVSIHFSAPESTSAVPAILVGHEGLGLTSHAKRLADRFARQGFAVAIPDLYTREREFREFSEVEVARFIPLTRLPDPLAALEALPVGERETASRVVSWFKARDVSAHLPDFVTTLEWLAFRPEVAPRAVGAVGFSMGAGLVGQILSNPELSAAAIFYGALPTAASAGLVAAPLLGHFAEDDPLVNQGIVPFAKALAEKGTEFGWTKYPGTRHGFFNESRITHHPEAAAQAWESTASFFRRHLGPVRV